MNKYEIIDILNEEANSYLGGMIAIEQDSFEKVAERIIEEWV